MAIWQSFSRHRGTDGRKRRKFSPNKSLRQMAKRSLRLEPFEERVLLAIDGPQLLAAIPATGTVINEGTILPQAPTQILLRFNKPIDPATIGASIQFSRSADDIRDNGNDIVVTPSYIGVEDAVNEVIVRFSENLPDDKYRMIIVGDGANALKDTDGKAFNGGSDLTRNFELDLAPQVVAVVPQPISRDAGGKLTQATNTIEVYFNANDQLDSASAQNVANYQLIRTAGTATTTDDVKITPTSVSYSSATGKAVLTFAAGVLSTAGTYRLRIGTSEPLATSFTTVAPGAAGSSFSDSADLGTPFSASSGTQTVALTDTVQSVPTSGIVWPGSPDYPGERDPNIEAHVLGGSNNGAIPVIQYNFKSIYGQLFNQDQINLITEAQKQRVREVFSYYAYYLGVEFVETASSGWTIAVGDPRVLGATLNVGGVAGGSLAIMNSVVNWGASETRGSFFNTSMHEIGHLLGLGHNYESPAVMGGGVQDGVFPGDYDILYGRYLWPTLGNDINVYKFSLNSTGTLNLETIAERLKSLGVESSPSQLDSVITLFDASGNIVARNDDYYGKDSFLQLEMSAGTYYVAVTSTGNTEFDPRVTDSGAGGTTAGSYQLRMTFTPTPSASTSIRDTTGNRLDGDRDGKAGGVNNFWFKVASNTLYVDKAATGGTGALGSITNPYTRISDAMATATQGSVVRIVGNGGADGNLGTVADNLSYNIGYDNQNIALSDGTKFDIPKGVTVMIDAGAILKLRGANVNAGSYDVNIDRSTGALQVLGTTAQDSQGRDIGSVYFTSYYNRTIGTDPGVNTSGLAKGNWGGIVFRNDSDLESNGIFLNYVNQARISYGGGSVSVSGSSSVYQPIDMETARPTITFNTITNSADAAMAATPNSFEESEFLGAGFQADYTRVGPKVYGNTLLQNSINGLFILVRTSTTTGNVLDELTVSARIANTDIVHVLTETLSINGATGGMYSSDGSTTNLTARPSGRLAIDPGTIFKASGGRFETEIGAQLIAEGTLDRPIIFTSLYDDRYGASGTSDTSNNGTAVLPSQGNWGGFIFGPTSTGSIDYSLVAFAGGSVRFEGSPNTMDPVEIHQAQVRIANSTFEQNLLTGGGARNGRGASDAAVIYIRGAQPVILGNVFQNNTGGAVISVNLNSLNDKLVDDWGRSRGAIGLAGSYPTNMGPLIRNNLVGNNSVNGMVVRGGLLTTSSVWDDTDIVHVVTSTITVGNQQGTSGTLRLQSSPTESLVVKVLGTNVDIVAGGEVLDITDRTGGTLQILGTPGHAVVITSLKDDSVGAGLTPQGTPQKDTLNRKGVVEPELPNLPNSGPIILDAAARDVHGSSFGGRDGWDTLLRELAYVYNNSLVTDHPGMILAIGYEEDPTPNGSLSIPYSADAINWAAQQLGVQLVFADTGPEIASAMSRLTDFSAVFVMSHNGYPLPNFRDDPYDDRVWWGGVTDFMLDTMNANKANLLNYVNNQGGGLLVMAQDTAANPYQFITPNDGDPFILNTIGGNTETATELTPANFADVGLTDIYLNEGGPYLYTFEGSTNFNRLEPWAVDPVSGETVMLGQAARGKGVGRARDVLSPGDWGSIRLDALSNDTNVDTVIETEQGFTSAGDSNQTPTKAEYLGELAKDRLSGDDNARLGFEIHGAISQAANNTGGGDVDVYSFRATAGTTVWFDIDKTSTSLDSVVELVDANGAVIARSDNSIQEGNGTLPLVGSAQPLRSGTEQSSLYSQPDFYTTNEKDAGMRVKLPGAAGSVGNYFVRVRSSSSNLENLTGGVTKGSYVLQVRLQEKDVIPGSTVRYADVRYANDGIEVIGKPESSILRSGTVTSGLNRNTFDTAQDVGNVLESTNNTIDVAGNLSSADDVDWYKFTLNYEQIQSIAGLNDGLRSFAAMLQVNYADGLGRPDTTLSLYDESGTLIYIARDGEIADSLPRPNIGGIGTDPGNLKHGSFGPLDPTLGPIELTAGAPKIYNNGVLDPSSVVTYYVAISSNATLPEALTASFSQTSSNPLIRLEPVASVKRIIDDRVGFTGSGITTAGSSGALFAGSTASQLNSYADDYGLGDVVLFVNTEDRTLRTINPFTGQQMTTGSLSVPSGVSGYSNIAMRNDGQLSTFSRASSAANSGNYVQLNTADGSVLSNNDDGLITGIVTGGSGTSLDPYTFTPSDLALQYTAYAYWQSDNSTSRRLFAFAERQATDNGGSVPGAIIRNNLLFELDPDTGEVLHKVTGSDFWNPFGPSSGTDAIPVGQIDTGSNGQFVGMTIVGDRMFAITAKGVLYEIGDFLIDPNANTNVLGQQVNKATRLTTGVQVPLPANVSLTGLTSGPLHVEGGAYQNTLFAIDTNGVLYSFNTDGTKRGVFLNGSWTVATGASNAQGLAFSSFDYNLWHSSTNRATDAGHGINPTADKNIDRTTSGTSSNQLIGGASYYFGLSPNTTSSLLVDPQPGASAFVSNSSLLNTYAVPGGTYGSLTSGTFDLAGYTGFDKPTLYFNYYLDTQDVNSNLSATDAFRVYASTDGVNWELLATNNVVSNSDSAETPRSITPSGGSYKGQSAKQKVQGLYDNTPDPNVDGDFLWRQARVDLGDYAGKSNIQLRFSFSTAGTLASGSDKLGTGRTIKALAGSALSDGDTFTIGGQAFVFRKGNPATLPNEISINNGMSSDDVAKEMAAALDRVFVVGAGNVDDLSIYTVAKVAGDVLHVYGYTINSGGPLAFNNGQLTGDNHGEFDNRTRDRSQTAFEGVYIDDFVVGFASRGEIVTGADNILTNALATTFASVPDVSTDPDQNLVGDYQLQIRPAQSFGSMNDDGELVVTKTFDVNDRFAQGITLVAQSGSLIADGQAFVIDDGSQVLTFEFDSNASQSIAGSVVISFSTSDSAANIAIKIRNAINNAVTSQNFNVRAATRTGGARVDLFDALSVSSATGVNTGLANVLVFNTVGDTRPVNETAAPGQTIIQNTIVRNSRQVGIRVIPVIGEVQDTVLAFTDAGQFAVGIPGNTGSIAVLPVENSKGWVPGVTVKNNLVIHSGRTGIQVGGDPNASYSYSQGIANLGWGGIPASASGSRETELFLPFVRVINNTVYDARVGIAATNASSPTIMNNVVANVQITTGDVIKFQGAAIWVDAASGAAKALPSGISSKFGETVVTANLYKNNSLNQDGSSETLAISLGASDPLFVDAANDNFNLDANTLAIDSSVDSLLDRPELSNVVAPLGIGISPILAPDRDLLGQERIDDPNVSPPTGVGGNAFKDRGALERADFTGPTASLLNPVDNDAAGADRNGLTNQVQLVNALLTDFTIQLLDDGVGIDDSSVTADKFVITRTINGQTETLTPNLDYILAYDTNGKIAHLVPAQGLWINGTYTITLDRSDTGIKDLAGNVIQENSPPDTKFVIDLTDTITSPWQNQTNKYDVTGNGVVNTSDLLALVNRILQVGQGTLPLVSTAPPYYDVNGDGALRTSDLLAVVNYLLAQQAQNSVAQPQTAQIEIAAPPVAAAPAVAPEASPLAETNSIAAGLTMKQASVPQQDPVPTVTIFNNSTDAPTLAPAASPANEVADESEIAGETDVVDAWDDDLDSILTDLSGDLKKRVLA